MSTFEHLHILSSGKKIKHSHVVRKKITAIQLLPCSVPSPNCLLHKHETGHDKGLIKPCLIITKKSVIVQTCQNKNNQFWFEYWND